MKKIFSILFALVLAVLLMFGACVPDGNGGEPTVQEWDPDDHGEVSFMQLEWMASPEEALYPYSNVGEVEFAFLAGAGDWLLDQHGGGWLNVVIDTTAAGGDLQWAVQNLYLTYKNMDYLLGSTPSVQFSLGLDNETPIEELEAAVFLSSEPLEEQPEAEELSAYTVSLEPYLVGGGMFGDLDGGSATSDIPLIIGPFIGLAALPVRTESISIPVKNVTKINEGHNMCARGAVARSISYLGKVHNFTTDNPQDIYDDLVKAMNITGNNRTIEAKLLDGKNSYCVKKGLNITSEILPPTGVPNSTAMWKDITKKVQDALKNKCDVEIWIAWNATSGHMAMVTSVTTSANGSATITYVDDPIQGDGNATNKAHVISTNASGNFDTTSSVVGFMIECYVPPEEEKPVTFIDPILESIIREITGIPEGPIYPSDMEVIKKLDASESNITDITGLEHCTNLTELYLGDNQISGISPLANLTSLTYLCLGGNQISDISPLANLTSLTQLKLQGNSISDISPLASLTSLTELVLWDNQISDISPLVQNEGLGTGDYIDLWQNPLSDTSINTYIPQLEARGVDVDY